MPRIPPASSVNTPTVYQFRLYVAGDAQNSAAAVDNLHGLCAHYLAERHAIEIVDVFLHPARALADGIFMTPALVKLTPLPTRKIIGTLSETDVVVQALGLAEPGP